MIDCINPSCRSYEQDEDGVLCANRFMINRPIAAIAIDRATTVQLTAWGKVSAKNTVDTDHRNAAIVPAAMITTSKPRHDASGRATNIRTMRLRQHKTSVAMVRCSSIGTPVLLKSTAKMTVAARMVPTGRVKRISLFNNPGRKRCVLGPNERMKAGMPMVNMSIKVKCLGSNKNGHCNATTARINSVA